MVTSLSLYVVMNVVSAKTGVARENFDEKCCIIDWSFVHTAGLKLIWLNSSLFYVA